MRLVALSVLLILAAGCSRDDITGSSTPDSRKGPRLEVCPGTCCFGMHSFTPPAYCEKCRAEGLATAHRYCTACANELKRCPHCAGAKAESPQTQEAPKSETPPAATPPPPSKDPDPKPEEPKAVTQPFKVEAVEFPDANRRAHGLIVFAAQRDAAGRAAHVYRGRKTDEIEKLPETPAGKTAGLYLIWGYYPQPTFNYGTVKAGYDADAGVIRVAVSPWSGRPGREGIGMDWVVEKKLKRAYVGVRVAIDPLPPGTYPYEVVELNSKGDPKVLAKGSIELVR